MKEKKVLSICVHDTVKISDSPKKQFKIRPIKVFGPVFCIELPSQIFTQIINIIRGPTSVINNFKFFKPLLFNFNGGFCF